MSNDLPINQHYVPQFLLRNFCLPEKEHVYVFDKQEENKFKTSIKNIAAENKFYNFEYEGEGYSLEPILSQIESQTGSIIKKIIETESIGNLSEDEKVQLAYFTHVQNMRVKNMKEELHHTDLQLEKYLKERGINPEDVSNFRIMDQDEITKMMSRIILDDKFVPLYLNKTWMLLKSAKNRSFYISDNPIALQNENDFGPYGNLGLAVRGIEIYLPLSSDLTLAFFCKSHEESFREAKKKHDSLKETDPKLWQKKDKYFVINDYLNSIDDGVPFKCIDEIVTNLNSLQVIFSERFIFSRKNDFRLAKRMIAEHTELKKGFRSRVG